MSLPSQTARNVRFVGLSTALAKAKDWLGIQNVGLYNFKPSVRPVPLEVHIQGYPGKFYCPRMKSMNKPTYAATRTHSPVKPVLIFVSSRRQTRLTAFDLIQFAAQDEQPRQFLQMSEEDISMILYKVMDGSLKHTLQFGIGLHHAGLADGDRTLVEELFYNNKIQVLVCTSTLAWGINLPAHLVIIKGTEFFDGKSKRYIDYPITDVLQMMGRAGRPQFDQQGKAVILVHEPKKSFYKKFLYEPFPVESSLVNQLYNHLNAEIAAGTISSKQDALYYLTWTYLYRRLVMNPSYYGLEDTSSEVINRFLSSLVNGTLEALEDAGCIELSEDSVEIQMPGLLASKYYLHYTTVALFSSRIHAETSPAELLQVLSGAAEYDELPVRHNEENLNAILAKQARMPVDNRLLDDPHVKANLLLQAHFSRLELPISDYVTDTKSVLDQSIRIIQAMVDAAANGGWLRTTIQTMQLLQMIMQGTWFDHSPLLMLPNISTELLPSLPFSTLDEFLSFPVQRLQKLFERLLPQSGVHEIIQAWNFLPRIDLSWEMRARTMNEQDKTVSLTLGIEVVCNARRKNTRAFLPRYSKSKEEGWWIVVGSTSAWELFAMRRVSIRDKRLTTSLAVTRIPAETQEMKLYLVSDCYVGLDQTHTIPVSSA